MSSYKILGGDRQEYGPVTGEEIRQWIREGRANAETLGQAEGGMWKKLSLFPEFADLLEQPTMASNGAVRPGLPATAVTSGSGGGDLKGTVLGPAVAMLAVAAMDLVMTLFGLAAGTSGIGGPVTFPGGAPPELQDLMEHLTGPAGMVLNVASVLIDALIIWAGVQMMSLRNYGLCIAGAVLALVPCTAPCCCLGIAAGIWALVVLSRPEVKQAFG